MYLCEIPNISNVARSKSKCLDRLNAPEALILYVRAQLPVAPIAAGCATPFTSDPVNKCVYKKINRRNKNHDFKVAQLHTQYYEAKCVVTIKTHVCCKRAKIKIKPHLF